MLQPRLRILFLALLALAGIDAAHLPSAHAYFGGHSVQAVLTFQSVADVAMEGALTADSLNRPGPLRQAALKRVDRQIQHLIGVFQSQSFTARDFGFPGTLGEKYELHFLGVSRGSRPWRKRLSYVFRGLTVFQREAFHGSEPRAVPLKLPASADDIYAMGVPPGRTRNLCTDPDPHYNVPSEFSYFWDPDQPGCPLQGNSRDVLRFQGTLQPLPNTVLTYPEYDRLYGDGNPRKSTLEISVFYGFIGHLRNYDHLKPWDAGSHAFLAGASYLESQGFQLVERLEGFREYRDGRRVPGMNQLRVYQKPILHRGKKLLARVRILLSDTDHRSSDQTFHRLAPAAFRDSDIVVYDGHAGSGDNLNFEGALSSVKLDPEKYQIFFLNGCHTFPYFAGMFLSAKGGSRNMEVITSGAMTDSETSLPNLVAVLQSFIQGGERSYQDILTDLENSNGSTATYLFGVSGDEDNRWRP